MTLIEGCSKVFVFCFNFDSLKISCSFDILLSSKVTQQEYYNIKNYLSAQFVFKN